MYVKLLHQVSLKQENKSYLVFVCTGGNFQHGVKLGVTVGGGKLGVIVGGGELRLRGGGGQRADKNKEGKGLNFGREKTHQWCKYR